MVRFGEREIAHDDVRAQAAKIAGALGDAGVEHGDRVGIVLRNEPTFLAISAACSQMGAVAVPINWHSRGRELEHVLSHSSANAVFVHSDLVATVEEVLPETVPLIEVPVPARDRGTLRRRARRPGATRCSTTGSPRRDPAPTQPRARG